MSSSRLSVPRKPRRGQQLGLESLENRDVPAYLSGGLLVVDGTGGNDVIQISEMSFLTPYYTFQKYVTVQVNGGVTEWFSRSSVSAIHVRGYAGHDRITNDTSRVMYAYGGLGNDTLRGGSGYDLLSGEEDHDYIQGDPIVGGVGAADNLSGGDGNDDIAGWTGDDTISGGTGNDSLYGNQGHDRIEAGAFRVPGYWNPFRPDHLETNFISGGDGNDTVYGSAGADTIFGESDHDYIQGDPIVGGVGRPDFIDGGAGDDDIAGWEGGDTLYGGSGRDSLYGNAGNDGIFGGVGEVDQLAGGPGADRFLTPAEDVNSVVDLFAEDARVRFTNADVAWSDGEIQASDRGLAFLHAQTNNTRLLKLSTGGEVDFVRVGSLAGTALADNNSAGRIRVATAAFTANPPLVESIIHELAHNWDTEMGSTDWNRWLGLSGWRPHDNGGGSLFPPPGYLISGDGQWDYLAGADNSFARAYGRTNPREDWATMWEAYYRYKTGTLSFAEIVRLAPKLNFIDAFMTARRT